MAAKSCKIVQWRARHDSNVGPLPSERQTPSPQSRNNAFIRAQEMGCCKPLATTPQRASLLGATLPCETALWLFHDVDRRQKLKGWPESG
jgi:hypothetical protein